MVEYILANGSNPIKSIGGANQQIIVIPQSLLNNTTKTINMKPIVKVSPNVKGQLSTTTKVSLKRSLSPDHPDSSDSMEKDAAPVRKRANLDHLSPEEKLMRRKLKNRVAAQNARDKKRAKMDEMEDLIKRLEEEKEALRVENENLKKVNERLMSEKSVKNEYTLPLSPESLAPLSPSVNVTDSTIVVPRPSEPAELMNELLPKGQGLGMAVNQSKEDKMNAVSAGACLLWTCLVTTSLMKNNNSNNSRDRLKSLPLKKRSRLK